MIVYLFLLNLLLQTNCKQLIEPHYRKVQLQTVQTPTTILTCAISIPNLDVASNTFILSTTSSTSSNHIPTTYPIISGQPPYLDLIENQRTPAPTSAYVLFPSIDTCDTFNVNNYVILSNNNRNIKYTLRSTTPPIMQIFVLQKQPTINQDERRQEMQFNKSQQMTSAETLNAGAKAVWNAMANVTLGNLTSSNLIGTNKNYGIDNITNILNLVQTHMKEAKAKKQQKQQQQQHQQQKQKQQQQQEQHETNEKSNNPLDESTAPNIDGSEINAAYKVDNPFTHNQMHPSTDTEQPCVAVTLEFINCVKRHARVEDCSSKKQELMNCRTTIGVGNPTAAQRNNFGNNDDQRKNEKKFPDGFSFRSCAGIGGGCPASGGTPKGAVAKELGIPARPPVYSPTPLGPDLSDAGGSLMMSVVEMCIGK